MPTNRYPPPGTGKKNEFWRFRLLDLVVLAGVAAIAARFLTAPQADPRQLLLLLIVLGLEWLVAKVWMRQLPTRVRKPARTISMRFSIRELFLVTLVVAMGLGWWVSYRALDAKLLEAVGQAHRLHDALGNAKKSNDKQAGRDCQFMPVAGRTGGRRGWAAVPHVLFLRKYTG